MRGEPSTSWKRWAMWTAVVTLPGGLLLLPVVLAEGLTRRRDRRRAKAPVDPA